MCSYLAPYAHMRGISTANDRVRPLYSRLGEVGVRLPQVWIETGNLTSACGGTGSQERSYWGLPQLSVCISCKPFSRLSWTPQATNPNKPPPINADGVRPYQMPAWVCVPADAPTSHPPQAFPQTVWDVLSFISLT